MLAGCLLSSWWQRAVTATADDALAVEQSAEGDVAIHTPLIRPMSKIADSSCESVIHPRRSALDVVLDFLGQSNGASSVVKRKPGI